MEIPASPSGGARGIVGFVVWVGGSARGLLLPAPLPAHPRSGAATAGPRCVGGFIAWVLPRTPACPLPPPVGPAGDGSWSRSWAPGVG